MICLKTEKTALKISLLCWKIFSSFICYCLLILWLFIWWLGFWWLWYHFLIDMSFLLDLTLFHRYFSSVFILLKMPISWCFDVKYLHVDTHALFDCVYRYFDIPLYSSMFVNVLNLLHCYRFFLDIVYCSDWYYYFDVYWRCITCNNSVDMYNVQTGLKSDDPDWY